MKKFNPNKDMRIAMEKAHVTYRRANKKKDAEAIAANRDGFDIEVQPWEFKNVSGLQGGTQKPKITKEKVFDTKNDGKPFEKKKESKIAKKARAFKMIDGKKHFHDL
jgi:hypothetical protein|tara:strand:- start:780 stop:1100 length:321 start_codon:yes stop_codon:yes gene_type:complete